LLSSTKVENYLHPELILLDQPVTPIQSVAQLGAAVRAHRVEAGLTLAIAAPLCGVSVKFLQALETGKSTVQFDKALDVARHFGIQLLIA
jgi:HTH-type transcriptional regulator / antitoxin HipB